MWRENSSSASHSNSTRIYECLRKELYKALGSVLTMARRIRCKRCRKLVWIESSRYRKQLHDSGLTDESVFKTEFVCAKCKSTMYRMNEKHRTLKETVQFRRIEMHCRRCFSKALSSRFTPDSIREMRTNIHRKLEEFHISNYSYILLNGRPVGIKFNNLPFFGDVEMALF